jgi:methionyl-tRNA formyltransferase
MDDPIQTKAFIKSLIDARPEDIIGLAVPKGDRLTLAKGKSKFAYILSLLLIMGLLHFSKNAFISLLHKLQKRLHRIGLASDPSILGYAHKKGIPVFDIKTPNSKVFRAQLELLKPDVVINQSQSIIKKELLGIPSIGVINRHNALLPKNRGRLTPFWVLYKNEIETGVSIHFVEEGIDSGAIIVQEKYTVLPNDTFNTIVKRNYQIAPKAMLKALDLLEKGFSNFLPNDDKLATYNSTPTLREALKYRFGRYLKK